MIKPHVLTVVFVSMLSMAATADDQICPIKTKPPAGSEQTTASSDCTGADQACERNQVGLLNWLTDSHSTPSLHFIDFMEVFMR